MNKKKISIIVGVAIVALIGVFAATKLGNKDNAGIKGETIKIIHTAGETEVPKNPENQRKICQLIFHNIRKKNI